MYTFKSANLLQVFKVGTFNMEQMKNNLRVPSRTVLLGAALSAVIKNNQPNLCQRGDREMTPHDVV